MTPQDIDKQLKELPYTSGSRITGGLACAALHIVEGDLTKEAVLALLDIEIAYYQKDEPVETLIHADISEGEYPE